MSPQSSPPQWHPSSIKYTPTPTRPHLPIMPLALGAIFFQTTTASIWKKKGLKEKKNLLFYWVTQKSEHAIEALKAATWKMSFLEREEYCIIKGVIVSPISFASLQVNLFSLESEFLAKRLTSPARLRKNSIFKSLMHIRMICLHPGAEVFHYFDLEI